MKWDRFWGREKKVKSKLQKKIIKKWEKDILKQLKNARTENWKTLQKHNSIKGKHDRKQRRKGREEGVAKGEKHLKMLSVVNVKNKLWLKIFRSDFDCEFMIED